MECLNRLTVCTGVSIADHAWLTAAYATLTVTGVVGVVVTVQVRVAALSHVLVMCVHTAHCLTIHFIGLVELISMACTHPHVIVTEAVGGRHNI